MNLEDLKKATDLLKGNKTVPSIVKSDRQAKLMNDSEQTTHIWKKDEKYFVLFSPTKAYYFQACRIPVEVIDEKT